MHVRCHPPICCLSLNTWLAPDLPLANFTGQKLTDDHNIDVKCRLFLGQYRNKIDGFNVEFCGAKLRLFKYGNAEVLYWRNVRGATDVTISIYLCVCLSVSFPVVHQLLVFNRHSCRFTGSSDVKFLCFITLSTYLSHYTSGHRRRRSSPIT